MDLVSHGKGSSLKPKNPEKSKTLMRAVVNKPIDDHKHKLVAQSTIEPDDLPSTNAVIAKSILNSVDDDRLSRAKTSPRSQLISRFGPPSTNSYDDQDISVPQPSPTQTPKVDPKLTHGTQPSMNIFETSLMQASAEAQPPLALPKKKSKSRSHKHLSVGLAVILAVMLVGGLFGYTNLNKINLYIASSKAGFQATTPSYSPSGYGLASVSSESGIIQTSYHSTSDSRTYSISEKPSNWDSNSLLNNYVLNVAGQNYETIHDSGRTIYIYSSRDATWVNNGIWYIITGNNSLSDQQLIQLATTM